MLDGTARFVLGEREFLVQTGEAAEFDTMTPYAIAGYGKAVDVLVIFDRNGEHAHLGQSCSVST